LDRVATRWCGVCAVVLAVSAIGCSERDEPEAAGPEVRMTAADSGTGVGLEVTVDRSEIRTVDRVSVGITVTRPAGLVAEVIEPDWSAAGWERVGVAGPTLAAGEGGLIEERRAVTLEPFLEGAYEVPPVVVRWGDAGSLASAPAEVAVSSVLDSDARDELAGTAGMMEPEAAGSPTAVVLGLAGVVGVGALAVVWWMTRGRGGANDGGEGSAVDRLRAVAAGAYGRDEALAVVHRAVEWLAGRSAERSAGLALVVRSCERARFGGAEDDPRELARRALVELKVGSKVGLKVGSEGAP
jgi:hypothetical protein